MATPKKKAGGGGNRAQRRGNVAGMPGAGMSTVPQQPQTRRISTGEVAAAWKAIADACDGYPCTKKERVELDQSLALIQQVVQSAAQAASVGPQAVPTPEPAETEEDTDQEEGE